MERIRLYKDLYCAAMNATEPYWRKDAERIKEVRDMACLDLFDKHYSELTEEEMLYLISELNAKTAPGQRHYASPKQLRLLKLYMLECAIYYCELEGLVYKGGSGNVYLGEDLRVYLQESFAGEAGIPNNIIRQLYERWINPKSNQFLIQGNFKKSVKKPERFYYEYLKPEEASYLINRYREVANNLKMQQERKTKAHQGLTEGMN
jgi:hypothetical protein